MQEPRNEAVLEWWVVVTDKGEYRISNKEMDILMESDRRGARFVMFDKVVLNIAFIKEAYKRGETRNLEYHSIVGEEKFVLEDRKDKQLDGARGSKTTSTAALE